jgi:hypothetical protein
LLVVVVVVVVVPILVHGEQKRESNTIGYRLVKTKRKTEGGSTHSLKHLTPLLRVFYLQCKWQSVAV